MARLVGLDDVVVEERVVGFPIWTREQTEADLADARWAHHHLDPALFERPEPERDHERVERDPFARVAVVAVSFVANLAVSTRRAACCKKQKRQDAEEQASNTKNGHAGARPHEAA